MDRKREMFSVLRDMHRKVRRNEDLGFSEVLVVREDLGKILAYVDELETHQDAKPEMEYALEETRVVEGTKMVIGLWTKWLENAQGHKELMERSQKWYIEATGAPMFTYRVVQRPKPEPYTYV